MATDMAADDHVADRPSDTSAQTGSPANSPTLHAVRRLASPSPSAQLLADANASAAAPNTNGTTSNSNNNNSNNNNSTGAQVIFLDADIRIPRDGRVRSAVPSKLKNVKRDLNKSFAVMQMDVSGGLKRAGRDAAAKRVSESTALQAKLASTPSYVSHHRRANWSTPPVPTPTPQPACPPPPPGPPGDYVMLPLNAQEIKSEQARLLTLLRTLPPATVVDQFCKALAFFGGVPEAPPPSDGRFPESGEANGPGSLFVGWVSEIFPNLERPRLAVPRPAAPPPSQPVDNSNPQPATQPTSQPIKRPRGRPKGSKASKARSDKGIKKGPLKAAQKAAAAQAVADNEDSWVDEDTIMGSGGPAALVDAGPPIDQSMANNATQASGLAATQTSTQGTAPTETPSKKRGRPKGSKNRPKEAASVSQAASVDQGQANQPSEPAQLVSSVPATSTALEAPPTASTTEARSKTKSKAGAGAIKSSAQRRKKASAATNTQEAPETGTKAAEVSTSTRAVGPSTGLGPEIMQPGQSGSTGKATGPHIQTPPVKESKIAGKRKRQSMPTETDRPTTLNGTNAGPDASQTSASIATQRDSATPSAAASSGTGKGTSAKRARKDKPAQTSVSSAAPQDAANVSTESQLSTLGTQAPSTAALHMADTSTSGQPQHVTSTSPQISQRQQAPKPSRNLSQTGGTQRPSISNASGMTSQQRFQEQSSQKEQAPQSQQAANRAMYYGNQTLGSFSNGQQSYQSSHQQQVSNSSSATSRANPRVANSPQFGAASQSSPPIVQGDASSFAGPSAMLHSNAPQAPRRTLSTSSVEAHPYRPEYGTRQQSSVGPVPSVSHAPPPQQNLPHSFGTYSDPLSFLDQQEDISLSNTPYHLNMDHSQSMARNPTGAAAYSSSNNGMNYMNQGNMGRANHQNRWQS